MKQVDGSENLGARKFGVTVQQPVQIENTPINIAGSKYFSESCQIYLIHYLITQQRLLLLLLTLFLSWLLFLAFLANLGLLCMPHPGMGPLV